MTVKSSKEYYIPQIHLYHLCSQYMPKNASKEHITQIQLFDISQYRKGSINL